MGVRGALLSGAGGAVASENWQKEARVGGEDLGWRGPAPKGLVQTDRDGIKCFLSPPPEHEVNV